MANWGKWMTIIGAVLTMLCVAPIVLYSALGPADGNPIGLGLLLVFGGPLFTGVTVLGIVFWILGAALGPGKAP